LQNNIISGPIPSEISKLKYLEVLLLDYNVITSTIPSFDNIHHFDALGLSFNILTGGIPNNFQYATRLTRLELQENALNHTIPSCIGNLTNLQ
jgi:Leucine-rich repeat (LRR) protein